MTYYWIEIDDAHDHGRPEEIYGPDDRLRVWTDRKEAQAAADDCEDELSACLGYEDIRLTVASGSELPDWAGPEA